MTEDRDYMIDDYLEMPYWIIDILPRRVSKEDGGRYFKVEEYFLKHPEVSQLRQKFCNILLKLNCYYDIHVCHDTESWQKNPEPADLVRMVTMCMSEERANSCPLYILIPATDTMIGINGDDTYMTLYHPTEELLQLLRLLVTTEGLFLWQ